MLKEMVSYLKKMRESGARRLRSAIGTGAAIGKSWFRRLRVPAHSDGTARENEAPRRRHSVLAVAERKIRSIRLFNSVRFKISILYSFILCIILIVYSVVLYFNLSYVIFFNIDKDLRKKAHEIEATINAYAQVLEPNQEDTPRSIKRTLHVDTVEKEEFLQWPVVKKIDNIWKSKLLNLGISQDCVLVATASGEIVEKTENVNEFILSILKKNLTQTSLSQATFSRSLDGAARWRIIYWPVIRADKIKYIIILATSLGPIELLLRNKLFAVLITIPFILLFTSFLGFFFVRRTFEPIRKLTSIAQTISHHDMSKRVQVEHSDEEIESLVNAFNNMITRLENSFKYIEKFSADVSHELKTPLAIIRGESEVTLRKDRSPEEYKRVLFIALEEVERMLKIIDDLFLLTKLDYRPEIFMFAVFDLHEFFAELYEKIKIIASKKAVSVNLSLPEHSVLINANRLHLRRLFLNLLDNAIKFTPKNGRIDISVRYTQKEVEVAIADTGIGIPQEDLQKIFERFFHLNVRDFTTASTSGLGLSIAQSIVKIHHGTITVESQLGKGSTFTVHLPLNE